MAHKSNYCDDQENSNNLITKNFNNDSLVLKNGEEVAKVTDYRTLWGYVDQEIKWSNSILIISIHLLTVFIIFKFFFTKNNVNMYPIAIFNFLFLVLFSGFGVTAGAHRYYTHKCFKAKLPLRFYFILGYMASSQNTLYDWVRDHRVHHKFSDTHADPHNSNRGFFFSHCGWLMMKKRPEVIEKGRTLDFSDVLDDPLVQFHLKYFKPLWLLFGHVIPILFSMFVLGYSFWISFCWNVFRWVFQLNATWSVNSAAHLWGTRPYDRNICPVNTKLVSFLAIGEGWHNYHHTFPWDYKASEWSYYFNGTTLVLDFFAKIGWAYDLKEPSREVIENTVKKFGDGTHYKWGRDQVGENGDILEHRE